MNKQLIMHKFCTLKLQILLRSEDDLNNEEIYCANEVEYSTLFLTFSTDSSIDPIKIPIVFLCIVKLLINVCGNSVGLV